MNKSVVSCVAASLLLASLCYSTITNNSQETIYVILEDPVTDGPDYIALPPGSPPYEGDHDGFMTKSQYEVGEGRSWFKTPDLFGYEADATYNGGADVTTSWWNWEGWSDDNHSSVNECANDLSWVK